MPIGFQSLCCLTVWLWLGSDSSADCIVPLRTTALGCGLEGKCGAEERALPYAHVVLFKGANELRSLAAVLLDCAHHSGGLGEEEKARLRASHLERHVRHLKMGWEFALISL